MAGKGLTPEQKRTALQILAAGKKTGLSSPMTDKAAIETAIVESGIRNLPGGDADSAGWRQERASLYPDPTNVTNAATRFYQEAGKAKSKYGTAGDLAAAVQRPRADLRGKYGAVGAQADQILAELAGKRTSSGGSSTTTKTVGGTPASFDQAGYDTAKRKQTVADYLTRRGKNYGGLSALFSSGTLSTAPVDKTQFETAATPGTKVTTTSKSASGSAAGGSFAKSHSPLLELFWQGKGGVDVKDGKAVPQGFVDGHTDHVHVAAGPKTVVDLGKLAQQMGLRVGENSHFGGEKPTGGHATNSYHYKDQAIDVSGDPAKMRAYAARVAKLYGIKAQ